MIYYLKINRDENYTFRNLRRWLKVAKADNAEHIYVLCDSNELRKKVLEKIPEHMDSVEWIYSDRTRADVVEIVENLVVDKWKNAAYAHLTTFTHASSCGYSEFWNIDADDTFFCLSTERTVELLETVRDYSQNEAIMMMSLDMWRTRYVGIHWTFGITYTNNSIDWVQIIREYLSSNKGEMLSHMKLCKNVDSLFTYIGEMSPYRIESFYFENLRFIHYSDDMMRRWFDSGMMIYRNGKIEFPIVAYCFELEDIGFLDISPDVIRLDMNISAQESIEALINNGYNSASVSWIRNIYNNKAEGKTNQEIKDSI